MPNTSTVLELSEQLVALQRPIRVLDAVAWTDEVAAAFRAAGAGRQPIVDAEWYTRHKPLGFDPVELDEAFADLHRRVDATLGGAPVGALMVGRIEEYRAVIAMLAARGTPRFCEIAGELYGHPGDAVHEGGPTLASLGAIMSESLESISDGSWEPPEVDELDAEAAVGWLSERLDQVFGDGDRVRVIVDDGIVADAAAGSDYIKLRRDARFSTRDLRVLEVHEGWVHVATTLNGRRQHCCTFLGKGTPSTTSTQEGLAVFTEITTLSSTPARLTRITTRMTAIDMAAKGATFLDVYRWMLDQGLDEDAAWTSSVRVFRGSAPESGPFTKDLAYSRGFLEVYDTIRLAVRKGLVDRVQLLFAGKMGVRELGLVARLVDEGLVAPPAHLPPHVADISSLASWMAFSNLLNRIDLSVMEQHLAPAFD